MTISRDYTKIAFRTLLMARVRRKNKIICTLIHLNLETVTDKRLDVIE